MSNITPIYTDITNVNTKVPTESLRAFVHTNRAFERVMQMQKKSVKKGKNISQEELSDVTILDLSTYQHLPHEFLSFSDAEKAELIKELCTQNRDISSGNNKKGDIERNTYISSIYMDTMELLEKHLHVEIPNKFMNMHIHSINELLDFMNKGGLQSDKQKLYHCMLLKSMFLVHIIRSSIDLDSLSSVLTAIRHKIENHDHITQISWDETVGKMEIAYIFPGTSKPRVAIITFGEKNMSAIFDKLARKASYRSPDMLNDITRMNVDFVEEITDSKSRAWLLYELKNIAFGDNTVNVEINTKNSHQPIISLDILKQTFQNISEKNIPDIHNIQLTGTLNNELPQVRGVKTFECMCTSKGVDWNENGIGNRKIYTIERLQQSFARLMTGAYGILKVSQVKYALQDYANQTGLSEKPQELLQILIKEKKFLIPVNMLHGGNLCYRVRGISRPDADKLTNLDIEDLDIDDPKIFARVVDEFNKTRTKNPDTGNVKKFTEILNKNE